jgi:hypothetical protein
LLSLCQIGAPFRRIVVAEGWPLSVDLLLRAGLYLDGFKLRRAGGKKHGKYEKSTL